MSKLLVNWKTTVLGIAAVLTAASAGLTAFSTGDLTGMWKDIGVIFAGVAAIYAKDA